MVRGITCFISWWLFSLFLYPAHVFTYADGRAQKNITSVDITAHAIGRTASGMLMGGSRHELFFTKFEWQGQRNASAMLCFILTG